MKHHDLTRMDCTCRLRVTTAICVGASELARMCGEMPELCPRLLSVASCVTNSVPAGSKKTNYQMHCGELLPSQWLTIITKVPDAMVIAESEPETCSNF